MMVIFFVVVLIADIDINQLNPAGLTPLHMAVQWQILENIMILVQHGANVNQMDAHTQGWSAAHFAISVGATDILRYLLLEAGANANVRRREDDSSLYHMIAASEQGTAAMVSQKRRQRGSSKRGGKREGESERGKEREGGRDDRGGDSYVYFLTGASCLGWWQS